MNADHGHIHPGDSENRSDRSDRDFPVDPGLSGSPVPSGPPDGTGSPGAAAPIDDALLLLNYSRVLRHYVQRGFPSQEEFLAMTGINRGHYGAMARGGVDPKLSMIFRCTRAVGRCPNAILCEQCVRTFGPCVLPFELRRLPSDATCLRDLHGHLDALARGPGM